MQEPAGEARTFFYGSKQTDVPVLADQFCADTGCNLEDLLGAIDGWDGWADRELGKSVLSARLDDDDLRYMDFQNS